MKKLIIVEGIPGSGKSWTARFIANQLERNGVPAKLYHETTYQHPLISWEHIEDPQEWMTRYSQRWTDFLTEISVHGSPVIIEAACFQNPMMSLLNRDVDRETISTFIQHAVQDLNMLDTAMIYLYQNDPIASIHKMIERRGGQPHLKEVYEAHHHYAYYVNRNNPSPNLHLLFLEEYAQLVRESYEKYPWDIIAIENSNENWDEYHQIITTFLGLTYRPDPLLNSAQLGKFVGTYRNDEMSLDITITLRDNGLTIFGDKHLRPFDHSRFYLDAISVRVDFIIERDHVNGLVISEKDIFVNKSDHGTFFYRVS